MGSKRKRKAHWKDKPDLPLDPQAAFDDALAEFKVLEHYDAITESGVICRSFEYLAELARGGEWFMLITQPQRLGSLNFISQLEHHHYEPATAANERFRMFTTLFEEMQFLVVAVPLADRAIVEKFAAGVKMRVVPGIPMLIGGGGPRHYPVPYLPWVCTLEIAQTSHAVGMSVEGYDFSLKEERRLNDEFFKHRDEERKKP